MEFDVGDLAAVAPIPERSGGNAEDAGDVIDGEQGGVVVGSGWGWGVVDGLLIGPREEWNGVRCHECNTSRGAFVA